MTDALKDRVCVVTGAGQGLGARIAERFVEEGAAVMLCGRTAATLEATAERLRGIPGARVAMRVCDVADEAAVDALAAATVETFGGVDALVNNAGVLGPVGLLDEVAWSAWKDTVAVNLLGPVYLCRAFLPHLRARGGGKIINLSGGGATGPRPGACAYAAAKTALVRFTETLAVELSGTGIEVNAISPGAMATRMMTDLLEAGPERVGAKEYAHTQEMLERGATPLDTPASLCVYLASAASNGITGKLIAAVWDPWADFQSHRAALDGSDIYTLRRIVPKDRGQTWGG